MGSYSPVPFAGDDLVELVLDRFVGPTLAELRDRGIDYRGTLYAGLMLTPDGPKLVESNVRFGDPETQVVLPRLSSDLAALLAAAAAGDLRDGPAPTFVDDAAVCIVLAAPGYPEAPRTGDPIAGIADAAALDGVHVFHAGVGAGHVTAGGRVLDVVALGPDLTVARDRAYEAAGRISWPGIHYRTDIGLEASRT
jgi:phosphoribosylamine--glycine ligase